MHKTQERILELARIQDLSQISLRAIAKLLGNESMSPAVLQHHFFQLQKKGLLIVDRKSKTQQLGENIDDSRMYNIPIVGMANCGPANLLADDTVEGYLRISKKSLPHVSDELMAVRASGNSMNNAKLKTNSGNIVPILDGDYVVIDRSEVSLQGNINKYILSIIGGMANIKKLTKREYDIALVSESTDQKAYPPIIIDENDDYFINGRVVQVVRP